MMRSESTMQLRQESGLHLVEHGWGSVKRCAMDAHGNELGTSLLANLAIEHIKLRKRLRGLDSLQAPATFAGLLTEPRLQSHALRLETLVHFAVAGSTGTRETGYSVLKDAFSSMGEGACGYLEDPPEGLFIDLVRTPRGHFRIISGIWEASGFFLQRVINLLE